MAELAQVAPRTETAVMTRRPVGVSANDRSVYLRRKTGTAA
jgi:hypothetical protein